MDIRRDAVVAFALLVSSSWGAAQEKQRTDIHGEPLPARALARLGASGLLKAGPVLDLAFSADSKLLAVLRKAGVRVFEAETGNLIHSFAQPAKAFAFEAGPNTLMAGGADEWLHIRDLKTGKSRGFSILVPEFLAVSADGMLAATAGRDGAQISLWSLRNGKALRHWHAHHGGVTGIAFTPDGKSLVSSGFAASKSNKEKDAYGAAVWDVDTGKPRHTFAGHTTAARLMALSADGNVLATCGIDDANGRSVLLWDVRAGGKLQSLGERFGDTRCLAINRDGSLVATAGNVGVYLWDTEFVKQHPALPHVGSNKMAALAFAPDGKTLATADDSGRVTLWDLATRKPRLQDQGHDHPIHAVAVSPDGDVIATAGREAIYLWDRHTAKPLRQLTQPKGWGFHGQPVFSPDGRSIAMAHYGLSLWSVATGQVDRTINIKNGTVAVAFSPDGKSLAVECSSDARTLLWDIDNAVAVRTFVHSTKRDFGNRGACVAFSPDGRRIASGARVGVRIWSSDTGKPICDTKQGASALAFSPGGFLLAASGDAVRLHDADTGEELAKFADQGERFRSANAIAFSPDGRLLVFGDINRIRLWDIAGKRELPGFDGGENLVTSLAFTPDGKALVAASYAWTALIWDMQGVLPPIKAGDAQADWDDLAHADRLRAYGAFLRLRGTPADALKVLRQKLKPVTAPTPDRLAKLIKQLDDGNFKVRDQALKDLQKLGPDAEVALVQARKKNNSLEMNRRLDLLLTEIATGAEWRRLMAGLNLLEEFNNVAARELVGRLSEGDADARLTREAQATLERMLKRKPQ